MRHASWIVVFALSATAASASSQATLPVATRDVTVCIYKALNASPLVHGVSVYANPPNATLIIYDWRLPPGGFWSQRVRTTIALSGPDDQSRFHYAGTIGAGNNVIDGMKDQLQADCHADGGFTDEVFLEDGSPEIDMSQYAK